MNEVIHISGYDIYPGLCGCCVKGYLPFVKQICKNRPYLVEVELGFITKKEIKDSISIDFSNFDVAIELITDRHHSKEFWKYKDREEFCKKINGILKQAILIYERIHAKYIVTKNGLEMMKERIDNKYYGVCPRYKCNEHHLIPFGCSSHHNDGKIEFYCPLCKDDYYNMECLKQFEDVDGACFGPNFPSLYLKEYPENNNIELEYVRPTVYGFRLHMKDKEYFIH